MTVAPNAYAGPQCPHCAMPLGPEQTRTGPITCPYCTQVFEATAFRPPIREHRAVELAGTGPNEAAVCANHARNAAVTTCDRCGLFICSLCNLDIGSGSYCPSCFDRMRTEGSLEGTVTRYRNYGGLGILALIGGVFCWFLALPFGALAMVFARKGLVQRRQMGHSIAGMVVMMMFAVLEMLGGLAIAGFFIWGLAQGMK